MEKFRFKNIVAFLNEGREIEFIYQEKEYSITNSDGYWYLCCDTDKKIVERICSFKEKDVLASKISNLCIGNILIADIFDKKLYKNSSLYVL